MLSLDLISVGGLLGKQIFVCFYNSICFKLEKVKVNCWTYLVGASHEMFCLTICVFELILPQKIHLEYIQCVSAYREREAMSLLSLLFSVCL